MKMILIKLGMLSITIGGFLILWQVFSNSMLNFSTEMINKSEAIKQNQATSSSLNTHSPASTASYETVWVKGRSLDECMGPEKMMDENTVQCRSGYYEKIPVHK